MKHQKLWSRDFVAVCFSSFFLFMTFYILATTLPMVVTDELHGAAEQIGLVMTVFIISTVIFRPLTGKWMDERDRRKILFVALIIFMGCSVLYFGVKSMPLLLILRFIHGIGFGMATTATGAIAIELVPEERKGEGVGYYSLFMSLAMVLGPFLGLTVMEHMGSLVLFAVCSLFAILAILCGIMIRVPKRTQITQQTNKWDWKSIIEPKAIPISIAGSLLAFSYGAITTFISVYAKELGLTQVASYFFVVFAAMIVLSRPFTGKIFDRMGAHTLVYPGILLFTIGMIGLSQVTTPFFFLLTGGIIGLGYGALLPSFQTIAIQASPSHRRGLATGTYFMLFDSGYGLGAYLLGIVAAQSNYHTMYLIAGVVVAFTALVYYTLHHRKSMKAEQSSPASVV